MLLHDDYFSTLDTQSLLKLKFVDGTVVLTILVSLLIIIAWEVRYSGVRILFSWRKSPVNFYLFMLNHISVQFQELPL